MAADWEQLSKGLFAVESALMKKAKLNLCPFAEAGRRCRITSGPFQGTEGMVIRRGDGTSRIVLEVATLGQGASMEIDADLLELVD